MAVSSSGNPIAIPTGQNEMRPNLLSPVLHLLHRTRHFGKYVIGIASDQAHCADDNHENHSQHDGVLQQCPDLLHSTITLLSCARATSNSRIRILKESAKATAVKHGQLPKDCCNWAPIIAANNLSCFLI
jgi:hypothetical protein